MLLGAVLLGRSLEARQRLKAARGLQRLFDARPDQVGTYEWPLLRDPSAFGIGGPLYTNILYRSWYRSLIVNCYCPR